jgi:isopenicillin N synthase-like dioxygenase
MAKNLGVQPEVIAGRCVSGIQPLMINYYPPCAMADKFIRFSPQSDSDLLTLVLQVNHVQGLQIKRNGSWFPAKPLKGTFVVNIGDISEVRLDS